MIETTNTIISAMDFNLLRCKLETSMITNICPEQVLGFVPVEMYNDCRPELEYCNPVFAEQVETDEIFNDKNSFLFEVQENSDTITFIIQKYVSGSWQDVGTVTDNTYGYYWALAEIPHYSRYSGINIFWHKILINHGIGMFRLKVDSLIVGNSCVMYSKCFCLNEYSCKKTDKTIRFEANMDGTVGSLITNGRTFDMCGLNWYDSIRVKGYFGDETPDQEIDNIKYSNGEKIQVRDEEIRKYTATLWKVPMYIYQRFNRYGLYANKLLVTDYNYVNPDYNIKQKAVITDGGAEPEFFNEQSVRLVTSKYKFSDRFENGLKSNCCG